MTEEKYKKAEEKVAEIRRKCENGDYIFRGEDNANNPKIASTFYRNYKDVAQEGEQFSIGIEKDVIIKEAKEHFPTNTPNIDILTELQHYGGNTSLIDFTRNLHIALFFACDGRNRDKPGRIIPLSMEKVERKQDINYEEDGYILISPHSKTPRVIFQSSVFVHAQNGYIQDEDTMIITIEPEIKDEILEYLREFFDIHTRTIYNDIHGFIRNQENYPTVTNESIKGLSKLSRGKYKESIEHFSTIIKINPQHALAYVWRGRAKSKLEENRKAIEDFNKSIEINPKNAEAYFHRGITRLATGNLKGAKDDYNKLIGATSQSDIILILQAAIQEKTGLHNATLQSNQKILELTNQNKTEKMKRMAEEKIKELKEKADKK